MKVHFIPKVGTDNYVMFLCDSLRFYNVDEPTKQIAEKVLEGDLGKEDIIKKYNIKEKDFDKIKSLIEIPTVPIVTAESAEILYKLVLNITNKCNLSCRYCYASGGNYDSLEGLMSVDTAKKAIDAFLIKYKNIKYIQFFGGEPLLNIPLIRFVCEYFEKKLKSGAISVMPEFGTVSNGTICSDELIDLINKYNISITFSVDGPQEIHDKMRVYKNGSGTLETVIKNIKRMKELTAQPNSAEVTYSAVHMDEDVSVTDTVKFIKDILGIDTIHVVPVSAEDDCPYKLQNRTSFEKSVHEIFQERIKNGRDYSYTFINRIIKAIGVKKTNKYLCEAGISSFSVSQKGDVYPCFMFTDIEKFKMGNVYDSNIFTLNSFSTIQNSLKHFSKFESEKCSNCFNNKICSGCLGFNYFNNADVEIPTDEECEMQRRLTEQVLLELSDLSAMGGEK